VLGFAPLAAAPLGASGAGGVSYDVSFAASATIIDGGVVARQTFITAVDEISSGEMSAAVAASTFNAAVSIGADSADSAYAAAGFAPNVSEGADGVDSVASLVGFLAIVSDSGTATDSALVEASEFNATAADASTALDSVRASAIMASAVSEDAEIDDSDAARYLWTTINNAQPTAWTVVKTQN
jgi:hypothetical protein